MPEEPKVITTLQDLCDHFGADEPRSLNRRIYKDTACGASISLYLGRHLAGEVLHNGDKRWDTLDVNTPIRGFTIQTIVEGSDATVDSELFEVPVPAQEIDDWIETMEAEADVLWKEANGDDDDLSLTENQEDSGAENTDQA